MKDYSKVKFIKISDNNDAKNFYIDVTIMKDPRLRISALKGQYMRYLETGDLYRDVFDFFERDYSFCCLERGNFKNLDDVKKRKQEIIKEQREKLKNCKPHIPIGTITFN